MQQEADKEDEEFAIVFAAMGVNMETAHFFKQVCRKRSVNSNCCPSLARMYCPVVIQRAKVLVMACARSAIAGL